LTRKEKSAFIFPAFVHSYPEDPFAGLPGAEDFFTSLLEQVSLHTGFDLTRFNYSFNNLSDNELFTQFITYCYSVTLANILQRKGYNPDFGTGYSMGIYAALVATDVISFADGIDLIKNAHEAITSITGREKYGMCSIIGLNRDDIISVIHTEDLRVGITNQNGEFAFVLSGTKDDIHRFIEYAIAEGALHTREIITSIPYHSALLKETAIPFGFFVNNLVFKQPHYGIVSLIDQKILTDPFQLKQEVIRNLFYPLNWYKTQLKLVNMGVCQFVECGFGNSLAKNSKFIEGDYQFLSVTRFLNLMERG